MLGTISVEGLRIHCIVGIHPEERIQTQDLFVDCFLDYDFKNAASSDKIEHTIDYTAVAALLTDLAVTEKYELIETFAEEAAAKTTA